MLPNIPILEPPKIETISINVKQEEPKPPEVLYIIKSGDNLTKIAEAHKTTVQRLWAKNGDLTDPDRIEPEKPLKIPQNDEQLADRPLPVALPSSPIIAENRTSSVTVSKPYTSSVVPRGAVAGNTYTPGQCTWGVKNWKPEIPNSWGNASDWLYNAQRQGWPTGSTPQVGAVGWRSGHVVYIIAVHDNGTVTYKDMNGRYIPYEVGTRTVSANSLRYIY